jgi:cytochrome P450
VLASETKPERKQPHRSDQTGVEQTNIWINAVKKNQKSSPCGRRPYCGTPGFDIPRGSSVLISPYLLHRRLDFWPQPEQFDPSRFAQGTPRPHDAYLPFGLGQHPCVGQHLANKIAGHVVKRVFTAYDLRPLPGQTRATAPGITLRHAQPYHMIVSRKAAR